MQCLGPPVCNKINTLNRIIHSAITLVNSLEAIVIAAANFASDGSGFVNKVRAVESACSRVSSSNMPFLVIIPCMANIAAALKNVRLDPKKEIFLNRRKLTV